MEKTVQLTKRQKTLIFYTVMESKDLQWGVITITFNDRQAIRRVILILQPRAVFGLSACLISRRIILESRVGYSVTRLVIRQISNAVGRNQRIVRRPSPTPN